MGGSDGTIQVSVNENLLASLASRCSFPEGELHCAVSGGADSLALLALAVHLRGASCVTALHVDHQLRSGSHLEADFVSSIASSVGVKFVALTVDLVGARTVDSLPGGNSHRSNIEARARTARYRALPVDVCTGHTLDDLAETVLANLLRGAGLDGVSPMVKATTGPYRPLLKLRRHETEAVCDAMGWSPVMDPMNDDVTLLRSNVRHRVLPLLNEVSSRDVSVLLARHAEVVAEDVAVLEAMATELDPCDAKALAVAPASLARRALRRWLIDEGINDGQPPSLATLDRMMGVVRGDSVATDIGGGWRLARTFQRLRLVDTNANRK